MKKSLLVELNGLSGRAARARHMAELHNDPVMVAYWWKNFWRVEAAIKILEEVKPRRIISPLIKEE